jgi:hypothetical protein
MRDAKNDAVEVAAVEVEFTAVKFCKVLEERARTPPVAVVRPVIESVEPTAVAPVMVAAPETARVPVAMRLVAWRLVATVLEETLSAPVMIALPRVRILPRISMMLPVVDVALVPMRTTSAVSVV